MAAIIELKYFNAFTMKKIKAIANVEPGSIGVIESVSSFTINVSNGSTYFAKDKVNVGQEVYFQYTDLFNDVQTYRGNITAASLTTIAPIHNIITLNKSVVDWNASGVNDGIEITFKEINDFSNIPAAYINDEDQDRANDWLLEESRIRGGYNNTSLDFGVKAYLVEDETKQSHKFSGLIHSGPFNSRTGFNATNQFSVAEDITRTVDPANGSIQKLYAEDTNLIIFQENKVSKSLIDKDAIYTAEGNPQVTATNKVIGQNVAYGGEFGISMDPESFAVNGYRKYFTDRDQNIVCRLSRDGITPISSAGMTDFFRDKLSSAKDKGIVGGWDAHNKQYVLSITSTGSLQDGDAPYQTLNYDEGAKGWVSRYSYRPTGIISLNNNYYTTYNGKIYKHHKANKSSVERANFYGVSNDSSVIFVANGVPSSVKNFQTINYEGDTDWEMTSFLTDKDSAWPISKPFFPTTLEEMESNLFLNNFKLKDNKYYANLSNNSAIAAGEVVFGQSSSGVKGFYGEIKMTMNNVNVGGKELFAVSTTFVPAS
jgi:hypothetical protein